jgi:hypothetical protein
MVFGNEMCQTLAKQPENDGIEAIYRGLPSSYLLSNEDSAKHKNKCKNQEEYNKEKGTTSISLTHMATYFFLNVMLSF